MTCPHPVPGGAVVQTDHIPAQPGSGGASVRTLLDTGAGGPGLVRRQVELRPRSSYRGTAGAAGDLWFVIDGAGQMDVSGQPAALLPDRGLLVPGGSDLRILAAEDASLRLDVVSLPAADDRASDGDVLQSRDFSDCEIETTGDRQFRVLFGPGRGCSVATQFVGEIPPGRDSAAPARRTSAAPSIRSRPARACTCRPGCRTAWRTPARTGCASSASSIPPTAPPPSSRPPGSLGSGRRCPGARCLQGADGGSDAGPGRAEQVERGVE